MAIGLEADGVVAEWSARAVLRLLGAGTCEGDVRGAIFRRRRRWISKNGMFNKQCWFENR